MSEQNNHINKLRQEANNFKLPIDEGVWDSIEAQISDNKAGGANYKWAYLLFLIPVLAFIGWYFGPFQTTSDAGLNTTDRQEISDNSALSEISTTENSNSEKVNSTALGLVDEAVSANVRNTNAKEKSSSVNKEEESKEREKGRNRLTIQSDSKSDESQDYPSNIQANILKDSENDLSKKVQKEEASNHVVTNVAANKKEKEIEQIKTPNEKADDSEKFREEATEQSFDYEVELAQNDSENRPLQDIGIDEKGLDTEKIEARKESQVQNTAITPAVVKESEFSQPNQSDNTLESAKKENAVLTTPEPEVEKVQDIPSDDTQNTSKKSFFEPFSLMGSYGMGWSNRKLTSNVMTDLVTHKNDHESSTLSNRIGIRLNYHLRNKSFIGAGIEYSAYGEKYDFQHDVLKYSTKNKYQYLQFSLNYGQHMLNKGKHDFFLLVGTKWSILDKAQSSWVDTEQLEVVSHNNRGIGQPFTNNTYIVFGGMEYTYLIRDRIRFHAFPVYDRFLNSVYKENTQLNQKQFSITLNFGVSLDL